MISSLITIVVVLIIVGFVLYLVNTYIPMPSIIKTVINVIVALVLILWLLKIAGIWHGSLNV